MIPPVKANRTNTQGTPRAQRSQNESGSLRALWSRRSVLLWLCLFAAPASAHDLEKTQVLIVFARDGSFVLDVANDPGWLTLRLATFPGPFADRVVLWVDGHEVRPASMEVIPGATVTTHRMRGRMPTNARTLRWYYGLVADPYPLTIRRADGRVVSEEVQGDAWSTTIDLSGQFRAPLVSGRIAGLLIAALLLVPVVLRVFNTKDTKDTKDAKGKPMFPHR
jgi:hypothetical protein